MNRGEGCRPLGRQAPAGIVAGRDHQGPDGRGSGPLARHPRRRRHARPAPSALGRVSAFMTAWTGLWAICRLEIERMPVLK